MGTDFTVIVNEYMPLRELVFTTLRQAILKGEIQPGERLMEIQLADKMGVSRTPIREAIKKLSDEGLVTMIPRKGAVVAGISKKMLTDVLRVRVILEKMAYECAFESISDMQLDELKKREGEFEQAIKDDDLLRIAEADEKFHFAIYDAAGNDKLKEILSNLRENMYRYRLEHVKVNGARAQLIEEHNSMISALERHDPVAGLKIVEEHISSQENIILAKIEEDAKNNQVKK